MSSMRSVVMDEWYMPDTWCGLPYKYVVIALRNHEGYWLLEVERQSTVTDYSEKIFVDLAGAKRLRDNMDRWIKGVENSLDTLEPDTPDPR